LRNSSPAGGFPPLSWFLMFVLPVPKVPVFFSLVACNDVDWVPLPERNSGFFRSLSHPTFPEHRKPFLLSLSFHSELRRGIPFLILARGTVAGCSFWERVCSSFFFPQFPCLRLQSTSGRNGAWHAEIFRRARLLVQCFGFGLIPFYHALFVFAAASVYSSDLRLAMPERSRGLHYHH